LYEQRQHDLAAQPRGAHAERARDLLIDLEEIEIP